MSQPTTPSPVPRIEYVESFVTTGHQPVHVNDQPWHVRYIGANGAELAGSEQLTGRDDCTTNAVALARLFGVVEARVQHDEEDRPAILDGYVDGSTLVVPILYVAHDASHRRDL